MVPNWNLKYSTGITTESAVTYDPANFLKLKEDKAFIFTVRASNDAGIWFSTSDNYTEIHEPVYFIAIGGGGNSKSAIDRHSSGGSSSSRKILK